MADPQQIGPYQILARIASGGMGTVYRAYNAFAAREVALKVLRSDRSDDPDFVRRFEREADIMAELRHPNIAQVYEVGHVDDYYFIEMEYMPGGNLHSEIKSLRSAKQRMSMTQALDILRQISSALEFAHGRGLVHRDIKPSNILISADGRYVLTDFGIVWYSDATQYTKTSQVMGTPEYMSPEQCQALPIDARSDLYSLGCVLYEMLTGEPPFTAEMPLAVTLKQVQEIPNTVTNLRSDIPPRISELVLKLLAKAPRLRYQSATQLIAAIDRILNPSSAPESSRPNLFHLAHTNLSGKRSSVALAVIGACVLLSVGLVLLIGSASGSSNAAATPAVVAKDTAAAPAVASDATATPAAAVQATLTVAPSPTPAASALLTVTNDVANVRAGPSTRYDKLGELKQGQVFTVSGKSVDGEWLQIEFAATAGGKAWVKRQDGPNKLVQPNEAAQAASVIIVPTLPPQSLPAPLCPNPAAAFITFPQQGSTVRQELIVYGAADVPEAGYGKVEIFKNNEWAFVSKFYDDKGYGSELGRIRAPEFSSLNSGVLRVRLVTVDRVGQEIGKCLVSVVVSN